MFIRTTGIKFIETSGESLSIGKDFAQASALSFSREYVDIYACAWGPDGKPGASVGYNKVPKVLEAGTKYVSYAEVFYYYSKNLSAKHFFKKKAEEKFLCSNALNLSSYFSQT